MAQLGFHPAHQREIRVRTHDLVHAIQVRTEIIDPPIVLLDREFLARNVMRVRVEQKPGALREHPGVDTNREHARDRLLRRRGRDGELGEQRALGA